MLNILSIILAYVLGIVTGFILCVLAVRWHFTRWTATIATSPKKDSVNKAVGLVAIVGLQL